MYTSFFSNIRASGCWVSFKGCQKNIIYHIFNGLGFRVKSLGYKVGRVVPNIEPKFGTCWPHGAGS